MIKIQLVNIVLFLIGAISIQASAFAGSSSSGGVLAETRFTCHPTQIADAGYNVYVTHQPTLNRLTARLGEISFMGETLLPQVYKLQALVQFDILKLQNKDFELEFINTELPQTPNKYYPATLKLFGELKKYGFEELSMSCFVNDSNITY